MQIYRKCLFAILCLMHHQALALNAVSGWYGGIMLGPSYTPKVNRTTTYPATVNGTNVVLSTNGTLKYSVLADVGVSVGFRCDKCRFEGQFLYNNAPYSSLDFSSNNIQYTVTGSKTVTTPSGNTINLSLKGSTTTIAGIFNAFYDFLPNNPRSNFAPYVGVGVGYAYVINSLSFSCINSTLSETCSTITGKTYTAPDNNLSSVAGQAIVGFNFFLDDFSWFSMDGRLFSTLSKTPITQTRVEIASINFMFTGIFHAV